MKGFAIAICLGLMSFSGRAGAQITNVTTTGLTTGQCVQANGTSSITTLGCLGRKNIIDVTVSTPPLTNSECGSLLVASSIANYQVTMPPTPLLDCEFTFKPAVYGFYVVFPNPTYALIPGYADNVTQWTISASPPFRTNNPYISLSYNGSYWEQSGFSSPIYQTTLQPPNASQLAHGQVYFNWNNSSSQFQLCESNGPGGLIVDGVMTQVPSSCLTLAQSATSSSMLNYFYAVHLGGEGGDDPAVSNAALDSGLKILVTFTSTLNGNVNDQVAIACDSIGGAIQANGSDTGTIESTDTIELSTPPPALGTYTSGGYCHLVRLAASTTGHVTGTNGVQQMIDNGHYTLVGMCQIGPSNSVNDTSTNRGCASYYNRGVKTCINEFTSDQRTNSTTYTELNSGTECDFVTWGTGDPTSQSDLSWSISGMISNDTGMDGAAVTAGFGPSSSPAPETEQTALLNPSTPVSGFPFSVKGSKSGLSEGFHSITLLGKAITGGNATVSGTVLQTSLEIRIPQ